MPKVVIIGGGILGLYAAYQLTKKNFEVTILEKSNILGGALNSYHIDGYDIEQFYHHFFTIDKILIQFLKDIGLGDKILLKPTINGFYYSKGIYPLINPSDLIKFKPFSLKEKFEFVRFMINAKLIRDFKKLDKYTAKEWIIKIAGSSIYEKFFKILLKSKFGKDYEKASAAWFVERINLRSHVDKNGEKLGYLKGGFNQIINLLQEKILKNKGTIIMKSNVKKAVIEDNKVVSIKYDNKTIDCDYLISSIPPFVLTKLVRFPQEYEHKLNQLEYQPAICIVMGINKQVTEKFYWVNVMKSNNSFGTFIEHTNFIPKEFYNDVHIIYLASYVDKKSNLMYMDEKKVFRFYFDNFAKMFPKLSIRDVKWWRVSRDFNTGLIYKRGISKLIPTIQTPIKNVFIGGMFNSYPERSINKSVELGAQIVGKIINDCIDREL
jgi:protoporphyrinogen oxidase|tara:strand:+ start:7281 stop:8588 length:1308 start_codon:yes stop_codon:yes gene_type:complete